MMIIQLAHFSWMDIDFPLPFEHDHTHPRATPTIPKAMRAVSAPRPPLWVAQLLTSFLHVLVSEMFPVATSPDDVIVQEVSLSVAIMVVDGSLLFILAKEKGKV